MLISLKETQVSHTAPRRTAADQEEAVPEAHISPEGAVQVEAEEAAPADRISPEETAQAEAEEIQAAIIATPAAALVVAEGETPEDRIIPVATQAVVEIQAARAKRTAKKTPRKKTIDREKKRRTKRNG